MCVAVTRAATAGNHVLLGHETIIVIVTSFTALGLVTYIKLMCKSQKHMNLVVSNENQWALGHDCTVQCLLYEP